MLWCTLWPLLVCPAVIPSLACAPWGSAHLQHPITLPAMRRGDPARVSAALAAIGVETEKQDVTIRSDMAMQMFDTLGKVSWNWVSFSPQNVPPWAGYMLQGARFNEGPGAFCAPFPVALKPASGLSCQTDLSALAATLARRWTPSLQTAPSRRAPSAASLPTCSLSCAWCSCCAASLTVGVWWAGPGGGCMPAGRLVDWRHE